MMREALKPQPEHTAAELALVRVFPPGAGSHAGVYGKMALESQRIRARQALAVRAPRARKLLEWVRAQGRPVTSPEARAFLGRDPANYLEGLIKAGLLQVRWVAQPGAGGRHREFLPDGRDWPPLPAGWVVSEPRAARRW
jgi:hypothetical protein